MSTHKKIDVVCIVIIILMFVTAVLFMNGEKLGITVIKKETDGNFTAVDLENEVSTAKAIVISLDNKNTKVSGNGAYYSDNEVKIVYAGTYVLSGTFDGNINIDADGDDIVTLVFDNVKLNNETAPAVTVKQADKVIINLKENSENVVTCGADFSDDTFDGAIYSKDDLTINGTGLLFVTAKYKHGIVCNDDLVITAGNIKIDAVKDGIHANDSINICNADIEITAGDDGMTASNDNNTSEVNIESGKINILSCYEGIEAATVNISGGDIDIIPSDDGINASGNGNAEINISGGDIRIVNNDGRDADGLDSNGNINISGGKVFICVNGMTGSNCAVDFGSESGGKCTVTGGVLAAFGGSQMAESLSAESQGFIMKNISSSANDTNVILTDRNGNVIIEESVPCGFTLLTLSSPDIKNGETYTLTVGDTTEDVTVTNTFEGSGFGGMNGFGGMKGNRGDFNGEMPDGDRQYGHKGQMFGNEEDNTQSQTSAQVGTISFTPPSDGNLPEGVTPPEPPDGMAPHGMPGGEEPPSMPDGMTPPEKPSFDGENMPVGENNSENSDNSPDIPSDDRNISENSTEVEESPTFNRDDFMKDRGDRQNFGGKDFAQNQTTENSSDSTRSAVTSEQMILVLVSVSVLFVGIVIAKKKKY